ncbi:MAG: hypothetical protein INH41_27480 [Myxococcaceae bacterium]|jgi:hypothetical protein|nr:hypothetical protein [Myxococcaceae bacterium]MCA3016142.1 hypothetical protein [Myxococcaceae bacterium]
MTMTLAEAFDVVAWSQTLLERLEAAQSELSKKQGLKDEKGWLMLATDRLAAARSELGDLNERAMRLPELEGAREEHARALQGSCVDAIERLQAGITFVSGTRAPLLEALFGKVKLPQARRADREDFERFCADFEKKLGSGYCKRMLAESSFTPVVPVVEQVRQSVAAWRAGFTPAPLTPQEELALRDEIIGHARRLELPMRQARLLAEAALAPIRNAYEDSGIGQKPKRRKSSEPLEVEPQFTAESTPAGPDPDAPTAAELAELSSEAEAVAAPEAPPTPTPEAPPAPKRRAKKAAQAEA